MPGIANTFESVNIDRMKQIRRAHTSAKPTDNNPAWLNCHRDMAHMLAYIEALHQVLSECQFFMEDMHIMPPDWTVNKSQELRQKLDFVDSFSDKEGAKQGAMRPGALFTSTSRTQPFLPFMYRQI